MSFRIKFLSLNKSELEYEVAIRSAVPSATVPELRRQITKLVAEFPSEDILISHLSVNEDLLGIKTALEKAENALNSDVIPDKNTLLRTQNLLHHLYHRLNRVEPDTETSKSIKSSYCAKFKDLYQKYISLKDQVIDPLQGQTSSDQDSSNPLNIKVTCEKGFSGEIAKLKFDGKSCVRTFIQRVSEFCKARSIDDSKLLAYCTEIFSGDALHWFRNVEQNIKDWDGLVEHLKKDFDQADYDYRLISEIRARTQGETENITIYLSIMSGMFSRLSKPITEEEKLEIILHNIRPAYTSTLAAVPEIQSIDSLRTICRNFENFQARLAHFHEPSKPTADTIAPEFAYSGSSNKNKFHTKIFNNYHQNKIQSYSSNNSTYKNNNNNKSIKYENLEALNLNTRKEGRRFCPRCRVDTHNLRQCTANKDAIFCFVCGRKDVKRPDCPDCKKNKSSSLNSKN